MPPSARVARNAWYGGAGASARSTPPTRIPLRPSRLSTAPGGSARIGRGSGRGPASHGSRLREAGATTGTHPRQRRKIDGSRSIASASANATAATCLHAPAKGPVRAGARPPDADGDRCERCAVLPVDIRCARCTDWTRPSTAGASGGRLRTNEPDRVLPDPRRNGRGVDRHVIAVARRAGDAPGDLTRGDRDGVDRAGPGKRAGALGTRRRLVSRDHAREPTCPGSGSDPLAVLLDDERAALLDQDAHLLLGVHAASSVASGVSATAARIASRSSSASQSSAGAAMTFSASSRLDSSNSSIRSSTVAVQIRLET